eukprot:CAMPEP_0185778684 /NCGR_PEP_ID=MMETSP1174-20130828/93250_1 /TAXON_ID=35687 /ORGANISM="Dictyocha speculum, Strain CCMP1381" /LENGTH=42 /DNA_ID= /DNA_START= /DNA_END= /DNA_ORIENTATION=
MNGLTATGVKLSIWSPETATTTTSAPTTTATETLPTVKYSSR